MPSQSNFFVKASPLLLVLFIDGMGLSLIMPVLNGLIFDLNSHFLPASMASPAMHNVIYGVVIGIFMLCWFFGAAILGDFSDYVGRKKALSICLFGAFVSYLISAFAVVAHSITLLLIGRIISGLTAGSQPIAQAAIVDLSTNEDKARNIGFILLSISFGFIFGPLLGGLFSDKNLVSWFTFATPFYFAAFISLANLLLLLWLFNESFVSTKGKFPVRPQQAIEVFVSAFKHEKVKRLSILYFVFIFGWSSYYSFVSLFLIKHYQFTPTGISIFMAVMGVGFGIGTGILVQFFSKRFAAHSIFIYTILLGSVLALLTVVIKSVWPSWILVAPLACCIAVAYSTIVTIFSDQVDAQSQGWVMGITGSISALVWAINAVVVGLLATISEQLPIYIAAICLLAVVVMDYFLPKAAKDKNEVKEVNVSS